MGSLVILILICLVLVIISLIVLSKNYKSKINILFSLWSFLAAVWFIITYFEDVFIKNPNLSLWLVRIDYLIAGVLACLLALIFVNFPNKTKKKYIELFVWITCLILITASLSPLLVKNVEFDPVKRGLNFYTGVLATPYLIGIALVVLGGCCSLYFQYRKTRGVYKRQIQYVFLGAGLTTLTVFVFDGVLPRFVNVGPDITRLGIYGGIFFVFFFSVAIIKHRLLDIRMVVARSVAYIILLATLAAMYAGSVLGLERLLFPQAATQFDLGQGAMRTTIAVIMVFLFQPLRKWITNATDKVFFKNQYDPEELLNELSHTMSSTIVLIEMLYKVNDLFIKNIKVSRSAFVLFKDGDELYTSQAIGYKGWPRIDVPDFIKMTKKGILVYDELDESSVYKKLLKKFDASIMVPIKVEEKGNEKLVGIYMAGEKSSGDMFSQQDIQIFEIMAPEVAVGIENAKAYEEISRFNVTLREEVKRATRKLKDKNEELRELDKAKDEFISMASHQLRTPLTAIKGYLSMLLEGDAGEIKVSQYDFINEAYSAAGRMVGLINDLLNVSRMETGRFFLEPKECDIERVVDEEVKQLQNHAREKGLYLKIVKKGKIPHIMADETKIRQVVMNFIDNAVYYTTKGGVTVHIEKEKDEFVFKVIDTGIGVPKAQQAHLFEKFFRADNARQNRPDGTGLGIYLAKKVTEDHGGKIIVESVEGKGSTFGFRFPLKKIKSASNMISSPKARPSSPALTSAAATLDTRGPQLEPSLTAQPPIEAESTIK